MLGRQIVDGLRMGGERPPLRQLEVEHGDVQTALRRDLRIQLPQRAGGGVAGVGHQRLPLQLPACVDLLKYAAGHIDLAPDDEPWQLLRQRHGNGADGAEILGHVLSYPSVAPGSAPDEHAVPVLQRHRQAVHLGLHAPHRRVQRDLFQKLAHLVVVEHILQALQRDGMGHLFKFGQRASADALGGRIRRDLLWMRGLQLLQAAQHMVILIIGDGGLIQNIVAVAMGVQGVPQLLHFFTVVHCVTSQALLMMYSSA